MVLGAALSLYFFSPFYTYLIVYICFSSFFKKRRYSFRCTTQWFTIFKDYTPFIVIIKYWLYSLCCRVYPYSLFILRSSLYLLIPYLAPPPSLSPLVTTSLFCFYESVSVLLYSLVLLFRFHKILFNLKILKYCIGYRTLKNKITSRG